MKKKKINCMTPVFKTQEQEKNFAECAQKSINQNSKLSWDNNEENELQETKMVSVFKTKEQEELFARCARVSMNRYARLEW